MTNNKKKDGLTIITTHVNADFDALASMLAAQKLYPESIVVFPGSNEKNLRENQHYGFYITYNGSAWRNYTGCS